MKRKRWREPSEQYLEAIAYVRPRFQEVDMMGVVWHGHYMNFFEEGRIAFGREYDFSYETIRQAGFIAPLVRAEVDYFQPARFDEPLQVCARLHPTPGAWITFTYIVSGEAGEKLAGGRTVQAFTDHDQQLVLTRPAFFDEFLARNEANLRCDAPT